MQRRTYLPTYLPMYHFSARPLVDKTFAIAGSGDSGSAKGHRKRQKQRRKKEKRHTTPRIRWSSPTQLLGSGRDPAFSKSYGRM
ncbi:hypothetical protein F5Y09DRAFT_184558 [Xylaria sp. FL1042]|nr:hypothetical protein F5Y09DRAFT_184558 [Xylaria sp. FL1042]